MSVVVGVFTYTAPHFAGGLGAHDGHELGKRRALPTLPKPRSTRRVIGRLSSDTNRKSGHCQRFWSRSRTRHKPDLWCYAVPVPAWPCVSRVTASVFSTWYLARRRESACRRRPSNRRGKMKVREAGTASASRRAQPTLPGSVLTTSSFRFKDVMVREAGTANAT